MEEALDLSSDRIMNGDDNDDDDDKTLHVSGILSDHHQEFSTVHSALVNFMQFLPESAWKRSSKTCMKLTSAECTVENS